MTGASGGRSPSRLTALRRAAVERELSLCLSLEQGNVSRAAHRAGIPLRSAFRCIAQSPTLQAHVRSLRSANDAELCRECHTPAELTQPSETAELSGTAPEQLDSSYDSSVIPGSSVRGA